MNIKTADLCDQFEGRVQVLELSLRDFGGNTAFSGPVETIKTFEDNSLVRKCVGEAGNGRVLVVDGGASMRRALLGDQLAEKAVHNGWSGLVIYGCIRDAAAIAQMPLGVKALGTNPLKTVKRDFGDLGVPVRFGGIEFRPGQFLYADTDGVIVSEEPLAVV